MLRTFKYRIYPNKVTSAKIDETIKTCRILYNSLIAQRKDAWEKEGRSISMYDQQKSIKEWKKENQYLRNVYAQVLIEVAIRVDRAFQAFFRRVRAGEVPGYPKFKGVRFYNSFKYTQAGFKLDSDRLFMSKIGIVKVRLHRPIKGHIKTLSIVRKNGKYYASFSCDVEVNKEMPLTGRSVGIDMGLTNLLATSDGLTVKPIKPYKQAEGQLKTLHRSVSRKKRGSGRRKKAVTLLAKAHEKVANQRRDFAFKTANWLLSNFDRIFYEDLDIKDMIQNGQNAKGINDAAWGILIDNLKSQARGFIGKEVIAVDPRNTSQICSQCGEVVEKDIWDRVHKCTNCGLEMDRDVNAAINILNRGLENLSIPDDAKETGDRQK